MQAWAKLQDESSQDDLGGFLSLGVEAVALRKLENISSRRLHLKFKQWKHYYTLYKKIQQLHILYHLYNYTFEQYSVICLCQLLQ